MGTGLNPDAAVEAQWRGSGLTELVERLRGAGFRAGPSEIVSAGRLLARLGQGANPPRERAALLPWLRPIFCSSREEQARFDALFLEWAGQLGLRWADPGTRAAAARPPTAPAAAPAPARRRLWLGLAAAALLLLIALAGWRSGWWGDEAAPGAIAGAGIAASQPGNAVSAGTPGSAAAGPARAASQPPLPGLFPATREARSLRPAAVWPWFLLPLLVWGLFAGLPALQLMQGQRRSGRRVVLDTRALALEARRTLPALASAVAGRLERHVRADNDPRLPPVRRRRLDARRTVEATVRRHGIVSLRYREVPLRPSYLLLIDAHAEHDPRGRLFYLWAERLQREGLAVDIRLFRPGDDADGAPVCWQGGAGRHSLGQPLAQLDDPPPGQRLIVIAEAAGWLRDGSRWQAWFERARFARWSQRVFFTPTELRDWGEAEEAIERPEHAADPGFLMLPLDEAALDAWSVLLANGSLPAFSLAEPQRYPRQLAAPGFDPFAVPTAAELDRLVAQLQLYLGDAGFRWLAALAVPPLVRWELTLLLGRALFEQGSGPLDAAWREVLGRSYRRLARLPWLRGGVDAAGRRHEPALPDWLRLRLLDELSPVAQAEVRRVVERLLSQVQPAAGGELPLDFEVPPARHAAPGQGGAATAAASGNALYLGYLSGLTPRQLALRLPGAWAAWLRQERLAAPGLWARAQRWADQGMNGLRAGIARLVWRDGLPHAGRATAPRAIAGALVLLMLAGVGALVAVPERQLPAWVEAHFFTRDARSLTLPGDAALDGADLSADGEQVLGWTERGSLSLWSARSGALLQRYPLGDGLLAARFVPGGLAACHRDGGVRRWPLGGEPPAAPPGRPRAAADDTRCDFGVDAPAPGQAAQTSLAVQAAPNVAVPPVPAGQASAPLGSVSADGRYGVSTDGGSELVLRDRATGNAVSRYRPHAEGASITRLWASADASVVLSRATDGSLRLSRAWQAPTLERAGTATAAALSGDGRTFALQLPDGRIALDGPALHGTPVSLATLAPAVRLAAVESAPNGKGQRQGNATGPRGDLGAGPEAAVLQPGSAFGSLLEARGRGDTVGIAGGNTGGAAEARTYALLLSADGRHLAQLSGTRLRLWSAPWRDGAREFEVGETAALWWMPTGELRQLTKEGTLRERTALADDWTTLAVHAGGRLVGVVTHPSGLAAAVAEADGNVMLLLTNGVLQRLPGVIAQPAELRFSNLGETLWARGNGERGLRRWTVADGATGTAPSATPTLAFAFDDRRGRLAWITSEGSLRVDDLGNGRPLAIDGRPPGILQAVDFLPDGRLALTDSDGALTLWDDGPSGVRPCCGGLALAPDMVWRVWSADRSTLLALAPAAMTAWRIPPAVPPAAPSNTLLPVVAPSPLVVALIALVAGLAVTGWRLAQGRQRLAARGEPVP